MVHICYVKFGSILHLFLLGVLSDNSKALQLTFPLFMVLAMKPLLGEQSFQWYWYGTNITGTKI